MSGADDDDDWVKAAMADDAMVVELLLRYHHPPPLPPPKFCLKATALPLEWTVRQRRSKSVSVTNNAKKLSHRGSPTTPLSWSGATSFSGGSGGVGSEESSRLIPLKLSNITGSKLNIDSEKSASKRSRKKKTLAELKDEENSLVKERRELKREIAALRVNVERQRATNERLKRRKIELQPGFGLELTSAAEVSVSGQVQQELTRYHPVPPITLLVSDNDVTLQSSKSNSCPQENSDAASDSQFIVPDLNIPFDEPIDDVTCGIR